MKINLPKDVFYIIERLEAAGFEAYAVGGCVRDSILGKRPSDWDIASSAVPEQMMRVFAGDRIIPTGLKHGTITILIRGRHYELTTFRVDGRYSDGRRPDSVGFTGKLAEDLSRRDFTINAMAYNERAGLVDYFGGAEDLENGIIRCVGNPESRFSEDYLRMLRAYRFSCVLGFKLHESVVSACENLKGHIKRISAERIREEFDKIILSDNIGGIESFFRIFSGELFPELEALIGFEQNSKYHCMDAFGHTLSVLENCPGELIFRLCALFHDVGKAVTRISGTDGISHFHGHEAVSADMAKKVLLRLKYDNKTISEVCGIIRFHGSPKNAGKPEIRRLINKLGYLNAGRTLEFYIYDLMGKSEEARFGALENSRERLRMYREIVENGDVCELKALKINGDDIMEILGVCGKRVGELLGVLLEKVMDEPRLNTRENLIEELLEIQRYQDKS